MAKEMYLTRLPLIATQHPLDIMSRSAFSTTASDDGAGIDDGPEPVIRVVTFHSSRILNSK